MDLLKFCRPSSELVNPIWKRAISNTCTLLPQANQSLLECRLDKGQNQVDLSLSFLPDTQIELLKFLDANRSRTEHWARLYALMEQWPDPQSLPGKYLQSVWLEFDLVSEPHHTIGIPAVFLSFNLKREATPSDPLGQAILKYSIRKLLGDAPSAAYLSAYNRCLQVLPANANANYIGFMLSRSPVSIRAQFSGLKMDQIEPFLRNSGLALIPDGLQTIIDLAYSTSDRIVLCIDLSPEISSRIGLEIFPDTNKTNANFGKLLDKLLALEWCSATKRDAIIAWPQKRNPSNTENWPAQLMLESLQRSTHCFSVMNQRINHLKLSCDHHSIPEAKVYLAYEQWMTYDTL